MGNILEEFWQGNIFPQEQSKENSQAIKELLKLMGRNWYGCTAHSRRSNRIILRSTMTASTRYIA